MHFHFLLLRKVFNVLAKRVQRSYLSWHWRMMQNLKKNLLVVRKMTRGNYKFLPEHLKVSKLGLSWDLLIQNRESMSLKSTEELSAMTMKNDSNFEEKLTCHFKIGMRNLTNFDPSSWSLKNFHFNVLDLSKVYMGWAKKVKRSYLLWNWRGIQNLERNRLIISKLT